VIDGVVEAAQIFAGGNVVIGKGIKGGQKGTVAARGDVCADFIEFSTVHAGGIVRSNAIINSAVFAGNKVIAEGKKGVIIGGLVRGLLGVEAITAGNEVEVKTQIGAGYSDEDYQKYLDVIAKEKKIEIEIREVAEKLSQLIRDRKLGREINSDAVDKELVELTAKKDEFFEKMDKIKLEKEETESVLAKGTGSSIVINDKIFRGVKILIEGSSLNITQNTCFMKYRKEDGRIAASVIVI